MGGRRSWQNNVFKGTAQGCCFSGFLTSYLISLLAPTGPLDSNPGQWTDGFAEVGIYADCWLWPKQWIQAAAMCNVQWDSVDFQLLALSEMECLLYTCFKV